MLDPAGAEPREPKNEVGETVVDPSPDEPKEAETVQPENAGGVGGEINDPKKAVDDIEPVVAASPKTSTEPHVPDAEQAVHLEGPAPEPPTEPVVEAIESVEPKVSEIVAPTVVSEALPVELDKEEPSLQALDENEKAEASVDGVEPVVEAEDTVPLVEAEDIVPAIEPEVAEHIAPDLTEAQEESQDVIVDEREDSPEDPPPSPTAHKRRGHAVGWERERRHKTSSRGSLDGSYSSRKRRESHGSGSTTMSKETEEMLALAKVHKISRRHTSLKDEGSTRLDDSPKYMRSSSTRDGKRPEERSNPRPRLLDLNTPKSDTGLLLRINKDRKDKERVAEKPREKRPEPSSSEPSSHRAERHHRRRDSHHAEDEDIARREHRRRRRRESAEAYDQANDELRRKQRELEKAQEAAAKAKERKKDREKLYHYEKGKERSGGSRGLRESMARGMKMLFAS